MHLAVILAIFAVPYEIGMAKDLPDVARGISSGELNDCFHVTSFLLLALTA
jgi:hypothetical protein